MITTCKIVHPNRIGAQEPLRTSFENQILLHEVEVFRQSAGTFKLGFG